MIETVRNHYEGLLAAHYTWLYGGMDAKLAENATFFQRHGLLPRRSGRAVDLGAGSGFQSIPLAQAGFEVDAVDLSPALLQELAEQARLRGLRVGTTTEPAQIRVVAADLVEYLAGTADGDPYELVVCMGDTLTHLATFDQVDAVFETVHQKLEVDGRLVLGFRDLSEERRGLDRFLPVRSDAGRVFTCFLEYGISPDHVLVHDLLYVNEAAPGADWKFYRGCYRKLRIGRQWATERLIRTGFRIAHESIAQGFINLIALK